MFRKIFNLLRTPFLVPFFIPCAWAEELIFFDTQISCQYIQPGHVLVTSSHPELRNYQEAPSCSDKTTITRIRFHDEEPQTQKINIPNPPPASKPPFAVTWSKSPRQEIAHMRHTINDWHRSVRRAKAQRKAEFNLVFDMDQANRVYDELNSNLQSSGDFYKELKNIIWDIAQAEALRNDATNPYYRTDAEPVHVRSGTLDSAKEAVFIADTAYVDGLYQDAHLWKGVAKELVNIALGMHPATGIAQSFYELLKGEDLFGRELSWEERTFSLVNIMTFNAGRMVVQASNVGKALKAAAKARPQTFKTVQHVPELVNRAEKIVDAARQFAKDFEKSLVGVPPGERVAKVREKVTDIANGQGWSKNFELTRKNGRPVYTDKHGNHYSPDTQHGHIEKFNRRGKHQGSTDIDLNQNKPADHSGRHDIETR